MFINVAFSDEHRFLTAHRSYFKQEALTKQSVTEDGWFKTGDIGQWEADGTLSIIDRIKNLVRIPFSVL